MTLSALKHGTTAAVTSLSVVRPMSTRLMQRLLIIILKLETLPGLTHGNAANLVSDKTWRAGSPSNTMSPGPSGSCAPSGILIHPSVLFGQNTPTLQAGQTNGRPTTVVSSKSCGQVVKRPTGHILNSSHVTSGSSDELTGSRCRELLIIILTLETLPGLTHGNLL